jgi:Spermine/spermidine synthase domain
MSQPASAPATASYAPAASMRAGYDLFLVGFLVMFLELACIRWFAAYVVFLQFFTNVALIACFLGMSCGCMASRQPRNWLEYFPLTALAAIVAALLTTTLYLHWSGLVVDVGSQASPQEVFFGTEYRNPDVARFTIPIEFIVALFFILIALMFVGLGQTLGRAFDAYPNRVVGYTLNIGGSLVGIVGFSVASFLQAPPPIWFGICCAGIAYLLYQTGGLTASRGLALLVISAAVAAPGSRGNAERHWSPYYEVVRYPDGRITVNTIGHQGMVPFAVGGSEYSLIHLLEQHSGGAPFQDVLIIGAGSGNDIDHALRFGVHSIDAVEIDPVIQEIGFRNNPDRPYQDPRVIPHLDDGRHFLRTTNKKYDLIVYALVDSLILHSGYANIRLESYLFTDQAFADVKNALKPNGTFVTYNFFRQGWIVERVAAMAESAFGCKPLVFSLPYQETLKSSLPAGFTMVVGGCNQEIRDAFDRHKAFWLNTVPPANMNVDGFAVQPEEMPSEQKKNWQKIAPTTLIHDRGQLDTATDNWPFLYLQGRLLPRLSIRSMIMLGALGIAMVYLFLPKGSGPLQIQGRMFFLGAGFMLLETRAVVQLALLFGSTWLVNSLVFFTVLLLSLLANLFVIKWPPARLTWHYAGLFAFLVIGVLVPLNIFLSGGLLWRYVVPCVLPIAPMFFAGVIFARTFRDTSDPDQAFGSNIAGSVVGGLSESFSMLTGFRYLLAVAMLFYMFSAFAPTLGRRS